MPCVQEILKELEINMSQTENLSSRTFYVIENHPQDSRAKICEDDTFQTLSSRMGTGGNNVPMVVEDYADERIQSKEGGDGMNDVSNSVVRRLTPL